MKTNKEADPNPLKPYNNRLVATKIAGHIRKDGLLGYKPV